MDQLERGQGDLKKTAAGEQEIMGYKKTLLESGLLERIEKRRLELKQETAHNFDLFPCLNYRGSMDSDHFLKEASFLHTQYSVDRSGCYSSFCIEVKEDGIYWVKSGKTSKKLNMENISDQEIHTWFRSLGK